MKSYSSYSEWLRDHPGSTLGDYQRYAQNMAAIEHVDSVVNRAIQGLLGVQPEPERTYTFAQVRAALNDAADMVGDEHEYENEDTLAANRMTDLLVSTALHLLEHPDDTLDDAIVAQYSDVLDIDESELDERERVPEKGSPRWNELLVQKVREWLA